MHHIRTSSKGRQKDSLFWSIWCTRKQSQDLPQALRASYCNITLQHTVTHWNTLQHTLHYSDMFGVPGNIAKTFHNGATGSADFYDEVEHWAHTARHCSTLQQRALQQRAWQHTATHCGFGDEVQDWTDPRQPSLQKESAHTHTHTHTHSHTHTHIHTHIYTQTPTPTPMTSTHKHGSSAEGNQKQTAIPSYQRRPSSPRKREENVRFPTNLHGVRRSARPTSRWAPKAHRMMGKTH